MQDQTVNLSDKCLRRERVLKPSFHCVMVAEFTNKNETTLGSIEILAPYVNVVLLNVTKESHRFVTDHSSTFVHLPPVSSAWNDAHDNDSEKQGTYIQRVVPLSNGIVWTSHEHAFDVKPEALHKASWDILRRL